MDVEFAEKDCFYHVELSPACRQTYKCFIGYMFGV